MKLFSAIAATAVIGASFIAANPARANTGCYPSLAATVMKQVIRGGGSFELAAQAAAECAGALAPRETARARRPAHAPERPQTHYLPTMPLRPAYPTPRPDPRGAGAGAPTRREARRRAG